MTNGLIRVADAAPVGSSVRNRLKDSELQSTIAPKGPGVPSRPLFAFLLTWTLIHFSQFGFLDGTEPWNIVLVSMRYLLWPTIAGAFMLHIFTNNSGSAFSTLRYFLPFLAIGIVCSLLDYTPGGSLRLVFFWMLGVAAAAVIGLEVRKRTLRLTLFWTFFAFVLASILFVIIDPKLGIMRDTRVESGGAWRGIFPGKNLTGLICVYALIMTWFADDLGRIWKLACAIAASVLIIFAASQGAIVTAVLAVEYIALIGVLRRSALSAGAQAAILALATIGTVAALLFGASFLLQLLGRDASLSGRTEIWSAFFERATYFWLKGAGPGTFSSSGSPITADLAHAFLRYGEISSPHNMFIATFGEVGIFGLLALSMPLFYFAFVLPCVDRRPAVLPVSTVAFTMIIGGISESREVFGVGMNMFLLILMIGSMHRDIADNGNADTMTRRGTEDFMVDSDIVGNLPRVLG